MLLLGFDPNPRTYIYMYMYICIYVYIYVCIWIYVHIYIYIYIYASRYYLMLLLQVSNDGAPLILSRAAPLPRVTRTLRPGRLAQEGVPLDAPVPDVGSDEVLARPDIDFVPALLKERGNAAFKYPMVTHTKKKQKQRLG